MDVIFVIDTLGNKIGDILHGLPEKKALQFIDSGMASEHKAEAADEVAEEIVVADEAEAADEVAKKTPKSKKKKK